MKIQIKEIAEQAMKLALRENTSGAKIEELRDLKFAELVINECINEITRQYEKAFNDAVLQWDLGYLGGLRTAADLINTKQ